MRDTTIASSKDRHDVLLSPRGDMGASFFSNMDKNNFVFGRNGCIREYFVDLCWYLTRRCEGESVLFAWDDLWMENTGRPSKFDIFDLNVNRTY